MRSHLLAQGAPQSYSGVSNRKLCCEGVREAGRSTLCTVKGLTQLPHACLCAPVNAAGPSSIAPSVASTAQPGDVALHRPVMWLSEVVRFIGSLPTWLLPGPSGSHV